jgi:hypothetical protein
LNSLSFGDETFKRKGGGHPSLFKTDEGWPPPFLLKVSSPKLKEFNNEILFL